MTDLICYNSVEDGCSSVTRTQWRTSFFFRIWDGWPTWYAWIDGWPSVTRTQWPSSLFFWFCTAPINLSMLKFGFLWATSMELFRPQAPSCQSPSMCQCVGIVSTKERVMAVVANLRRSWIQRHLPRQRIWQCPLSDSKHGHLWLQNYWSHTIRSANLGA